MDNISRFKYNKLKHNSYYSLNAKSEIIDNSLCNYTNICSTQKYYSNLSYNKRPLFRISDENYEKLTNNIMLKG